VIADAVNYVAANGVLYFSARQLGNLESGQSGRGKAIFNGTHNFLMPSANNFVMHEFAPNAPAERRHVGQPAGVHALGRSRGKRLGRLRLLPARSDRKERDCVLQHVQNGSQNPFEYTEAAGSYSFPVGTQLVVVKPIGAEDRMLHVQSVSRNTHLRDDGRDPRA
jgi:hypothetical protein